MISRKMFGSTGHQSSRIIFGAADLWRVPSQGCMDTLQLLLRYGVNHVDVAASYGSGRAEESISLWMKENRKRFFLSTKTGKRTYGEAKADLAGSLKRLRVQSVDMVQLHNLTDLGEWEIAMSPGGALEALVEAREEGLTRFIGVTGHGYYAPERHLASIERFPFDAVLLPFNYMMMQDVQYQNNFEKLLNRCKSKGIAVQTIKAIARRPWAGRDHTHTCWYEPFNEQRNINRAVHWALGCQDIFAITSSDVTLLPKILEAATTYTQQTSDTEMNKMITECPVAPIYDGAKMITSA